MKSINIIVNSVLFVALAVLYILHFTSKKSDSFPAKGSETSVKEFQGELPIAFVDIDSVLSRMDMFNDLQAELALKQQQLEASFANRYKTFEQSVTRFQNDASKGLLTRSEMQQKEQQLNTERMTLENLQNEYLTQMQEQGMVSNRKVIDYIMEYLKEYNNDKGFQYIFSFSFGGNLLYADNEMDITSEVVAGINKKYTTEKAQKR